LFQGYFVDHGVRLTDSTGTERLTN